MTLTCKSSIIKLTAFFPVLLAPSLFSPVFSVAKAVSVCVRVCVCASVVFMRVWGWLRVWNGFWWCCYSEEPAAVVRFGELEPHPFKGTSARPRRTYENR